MGRSSRCEPIRHLHDIFWDDRCKFTIHISSAAAQRKPPDWVSGPEGISVNREDVTYNMSTRLPIPEGCLTATCDQYGMVSMAVCPTSTSLRCMEQGRLGTYVHPAVTIRPRSAHARVFGLGAGRAAARGCIIPDDSGSEEEQAAGGPGLEPPILSGRGAPTRKDGGGTRIHAMDIDGARRRSHEPTAVRPELGLGWPESTHRWTGTTCRAASTRLLRME